MHKKKGADGSHKGHADHQNHAGHQGHQAAEDHAGHHGHHGQHVKADEGIICTVSNTAGEESTDEQQACFIMSSCDHDKDPLSVVFGADYLVSKSNFEPIKTADFIKSFKYFQYQGHIPDLLERPPSA